MFGTLNHKQHKEPLTFIENTNRASALSRSRRDKPHVSCEFCRSRKVIVLLLSAVCISLFSSAAFLRSRVALGLGSVLLSCMSQSTERPNLDLKGTQACAGRYRAMKSKRDHAICGDNLADFSLLFDSLGSM